MQLKKKIGLITGGTQGIGLATAMALAEHGADLSLVARRIDDEAKTAQRDIESLGGKCLLISADLGKPEEATGCVEQTVSRFGTIDILVHSAGIGSGGASPYRLQAIHDR
jgi:3-oxoacyl-[acyl-carrier protein] reductase